IGWLQPPSFVLSNRRSMRRLRLFSCRRILACTRNPSWLRSPRKQSTFLDSENTEGFRVFQGISPPTSGEFAWLGTKQADALARQARYIDQFLHSLSGDHLDWVRESNQKKQLPDMELAFWEVTIRPSCIPDQPQIESLRKCESILEASQVSPD